jgi:pimeloyl-ACP methyl ester carboxylesterase
MPSPPSRSSVATRFALIATLFMQFTGTPMHAMESPAPEDIAFESSADHSLQRYVQILPAEAKANAEPVAMIALHGHGSDRWQYIKDARGECRGARDVAAKHGMIFISPDYRVNSWMGPLGEADVVQIIAELRRKFGVKRIFLAGASMGGTAALIFTALHPDLIEGVCSENGMADMVGYDGFTEAITASYGGTKAERPAEYKKRSAESHPRAFTMPVAITVGGKDTIVPPPSVRRLAAAITKINPRVLLIDREATGHETSYADTVEALEFVIRSADERKPAKH